MAIKTYSFMYGFHEAIVTFEVDTDVFTPDLANETLQFFIWDYEKKADPIDEVMKKYAIQAIKCATFNSYNELGVISDFEETEGYYKIDGSNGIRLIDVSEFEFDESNLTMEVTNG